MSLFSVTEPNTIRTRAKKAYAEELYTMNTLTDTWERVTGESADVILPGYLKTSSINFEDRVVIDDEVVTMGPGTVISFPTIDLNGELLLGMESAINDIDDRVVANTTKLEDVNLLPTGFAFKCGAEEFIADNRGLRFQSFDQDAAVTYPSSLIEKSRVNFEKSAADKVWVDYDRAKMLGQLDSYIDVTETSEGVAGVINYKTNGSLKLSCAQSTSDLTSKKMLLVDEGTKVVSYTNIPAAAAPLPSYLQATSIVMGNANVPSRVMMSVGDFTNKAYISAANTGGVAPTSTKLNPDGITFHPAGATDPSFDVLINYAEAKKLKDMSVMRATQETTWDCPNYATMGGTARSVVSNTKITGFDKPIHDFGKALERVGDVLWINLAAWNATVSNSLETSRGIILTCDAFDFATPQWSAEYAYPGVTTTAQNVYVSNTTTANEKHCVFIAFQKVAGGDVSINGWLRVSLVGMRLAIPNDDLITGVASPTTETMP